ncbi:MAG: serine hydrolase domain-containing protein [Gemmatimonadales bacterium]
MRTLSTLLAAIVAAPALPAALAQPLEQRLQARLDSLHQAGRFIGVSAGVALADGRVIALASGSSDTARKTSLRPTDRMLAGSTGKTFFAALALQLVRDGRLDLDAPIAQHLGREPWFDSLPNARSVTVRQLMNHTSGLVRYELNPRFLADLVAEPQRRFEPVEELRYLFGESAPFAAGEGWDYSDTNYIVLAMIVERVLGARAYDAILHEFVRPLGLDGTVPQDGPVIPGLAQGYAGRDNPFGPFDAVLRGGRFAINPQFEWAGGGWATTGRDLARWAKALYEGDAIDSTLLHREVLQGIPAKMLGPNARYGLGVIIQQTPLGTTWGHSGFFPGYLTEMRYYPARRVAVAVMVNQNRPAMSPARIASSLAELVLEPPPAR